LNFTAEAEEKKMRKTWPWRDWLRISQDGVQDHD